MEDLNLRREFWEAMGWRECREVHMNIEPHHRCGCLQDHAGNTYSNASLPPVETDEGIALREAMKFCASFNPPLRWELYGSTEALCVIGEYGKQFSCEGGETPARAICRAIISAVKGQHEATE